jgi:Tol biopolymer transport system component
MRVSARRVSIAVVALIGLISVSSAHATFPGANGRIAFSQGDLGPGGDLSAHSQVFTIRPDGGGLAQLTHVGAHRAAGVPDWSPDGERIAYESNQSGAFHIWVMNADGSHQTQLTDDSGFEDFQPSWSPDGERILFSHCGEPLGFIAFCDVAVINADGNGLHTLLSAGRWTNIRPVYSPHGNRIAFETDRGGLQSAIWVMKADGSKLRRLTSAKLRAFWPDWAPDGKRILFADNCCLPNSNLWTVRPHGNPKLAQMTDVPFPLDLAFASFSPDGEKIVAFFSRGCGDAGCRHFYTLDADGSHFHEVVTGKPNTFNTDWGPESEP